MHHDDLCGVVLLQNLGLRSTVKSRIACKVQSHLHATIPYYRSPGRRLTGNGILVAQPHSGVSPFRDMADLSQRCGSRSDRVAPSQPRPRSCERDGKKKTGGTSRRVKERRFRFDEGVPQEIVFFGQEDLPLSLLSLVESRWFEDVARAVRVIRDRLRPEDDVAVMVFHRDPCVVQRFTAQKEAVIAASEDLASRARREILPSESDC